MSNYEKRKVEVWNRGKWDSVPFGALRIGQIFRLFEQGKDKRMEPILNQDNGPWNRCTGTPYPFVNENEEHVLAVEAVPVSKLPTEFTDE